ncbi:MAG: maleylpyruvate isomerase N-terminal domain-containing protein [Acidimicrobiales bacterium]
MRLTPCYDGPPVLVVDGPVDDPSVPLLRQRQRLRDVLAGLDQAQWATESRCAGWSVQDVIAHLVGTNQFWAASMAAGLAGVPTRFLGSFDPVATPAEMVGGMRSLTPADVLARFVESNAALAALVGDLDPDAWTVLAEAPPGHVPLHAVALHALWDAWIHERDVVLPLGLPAAEEPDEVAACLMYVAGVGPAFSVSSHPGRRGLLAVEATDPDLQLLVEAGPTVHVRSCAAAAGTPTLAGTAVDLVEALSFRAPLQHDLLDDARWMITGLGTVFDVA